MYVPILMYHEVAREVGASEAPASWTVTRSQFRSHLDWLSQNGYTGVSLDGWLAARDRQGIRPVVITFDDGYRGNIEYALPALQEKGWTATFFVISGYVGEAPYADASDWRAASVAGMEVGSHAATHPFLGTLDRGSALREMADSRKALEDAIGGPVRGFSWPRGDVRADGLALLKETGYQWAATSNSAFATPCSDPLALPRLPVRAWYDVTTLAGLVDTGTLNRFRLSVVYHSKMLVRRILGRSLYDRLRQEG